MELEAEELDLSAQSLEAQARDSLSTIEIGLVKRLAYYVGKTGLTLKEACMLVDVDFEVFEEKMKLKPILGKIIKIKELEYKKDLLHTVSSKARSGDDKLAMELLRTRYPEEYGEKSKKSSSESNDDMIYEAVRIIRKGNDSKPLVSQQSALPEASPEEERIIDVTADISKILANGV